MSWRNRMTLNCLFGGLLCLLGGFVFGLDEIRMRWGAEVVEGRVLKVDDDIGRRGRVERSVQYVFRASDGKSYKKWFGVAQDWERPEDGRVQVRYDTENPELSRLEEAGSKRPLFFLGGGVVLLGIFAALFFSRPI